MRHRTISTSDDYLDSRDIEKRIDELESERDTDNRTCVYCGSEIEPEDVDTPCTDSNEPETVRASHTMPCEADATRWEDTSDDADELAAWTGARDDCGSREWLHGLQLIRDDCFEDYARDLAEDIGAIGKDAPWPACHIDWEAAAEALQQDYSTVTIDGTDYHYRD